MLSVRKLYLGGYPKVRGTFSGVPKIDFSIPRSILRSLYGIVYWSLLLIRDKDDRLSRTTTLAVDTVPAMQ